MPAQNMPAAEVDVDEGLVRSLLAAQHPDLAELRLTPLAYGWDNAIFRAGEDLTVRLPRRELAAVLVEHEQRWLPELAPRLPLPIPVSVRNGRPGEGYPWKWSVCPWFEGQPATATPPSDEATAARALGGFVGALHQPAPQDAPPNPYRGVPLRDRNDAFVERVAQLGPAVDAHEVTDRWHAVLDIPAWEGPPQWLHGDLHPANVLVHDGHVAAVIDFGDLTSGDPATDLAVAWMMFAPAGRETFRDAAGEIDDDTWGRGRGWALNLAVAILANSADNPPFAALGERTLAAVLGDT